MKLFGSGILFGVPLTDVTGAAIASPTPVQFGTLQDISVDISFELKQLYGSYQFPIAQGRGKGKIEGKAKNAEINGAIFSDIILGTSSSAGIKAVYPNYAASIPGGTPWTITISPPNSGTFLADMGVINASTGLPLKRVASGPATGQYSVSTVGVYTFASADANQAVLISYEYSAASATGPRIIPINNQLMGYVPTFKAALNLSYAGKQVTLVLNSCSSGKLGMALKNDDFSVPEFDFTAAADASGSVGYIALSE